MSLARDGGLWLGCGPTADPLRTAPGRSEHACASFQQTRGRPRTDRLGAVGARIDFLSLLRDIGIGGDLIERAVAAAGSDDESVSYSKVGRFVSLHHPFPYNIPEPEDGDDEPAW